MAAGVLLSGVAHAGLVGLVLGLPWLVPPAGSPAPALEVTLVTPSELATAVAAARARAPVAAAPAEEPAPEPVPKAEATPPAEPPAAEPLPDEEAGEEALSLAPAFDPERTLAPGPELAMASPGAAVRGTRLPSGPLLTSEPPRPRPGGGGGAPVVVTRGLAAPAADDEPGGLRAGLEAGVDAALAEAQGPPKGGGVGGTATVNVIITREGRLVAARLVRSSGSRMLDVASLAAARNARYPAAPEGLSGARFTFTVSLDYEP